MCSSIHDACISGMIFIAVYYRSGGVWTVIFLHGYGDCAAGIASEEDVQQIYREV